MIRNTILARVAPLAAVIALAAGCGEGGGAAPQLSSSTSTPTPTSGSLPTFNTLPFALGQPGGFAYTVLGYKVASKAGPFENIADPATIDTTASIGFLHAGSGNFRLSIGGIGEGPVQPNGGGGIANDDGRTTQFGFKALTGAGSISEAYDLFARPLTSTAFGYLSVPARPTELYYADDYVFLYGAPTTPSAVPASGIAEYRNCCETTYFGVEIDFVSGAMRVTRPADGIAFVDVKLGADRSTFGGRFTSSQGEGTLEGRMNGPDGREMMMRLVVPGKAVYLLALRRIGST